MGVRPREKNFSPVYFKLLVQSLEPFTKSSLVATHLASFPSSDSQAIYLFIRPFSSTPSTKF